ncbi:DUF4397 domain-containing protein [Hymenobacter elongatus]|uniref:DUF4397 domain-containing protein n=1 Tax=Hymenobacter elongatus TaxID=877208 RepID=A0A4Z0PQE6_9BACT|nr:DUF4397 domain-containing protein [Hymenobacter elongatus]TGE19937.1 DUF4397 domain-containing protein [Hymenobacter elongatus]
MKTLLDTLQRSFLAVALPAALVLAGCGKDDESPAPAPDQANVLTVHAAANNSTLPIKSTIGDRESANVSYGANSGYRKVLTGSLPVKVTIAAAGGATLTSGTQTLAKDRYYSYFVYSAVGQATNTSANLWVEDDLTVPTTGAKVRLVHVGQGLVSPLGLSRPDGSGMLVPVVTPISSGAASAFVAIPSGTASYNLVNATNNTIVPLAGASVLATNFAAGKIYTIVVRGSSSPATSNEQFTIDLITHN